MTAGAVRIAVIGAGVMGRGIAQVAAQAGAITSLVDSSDSQLRSALAAISDDLEEGVRRGKLARDSIDATMDRLLPSSNVEAACRGAVLVVEAVVEQIEAKRAVFAAAERATGGQAVIATNTSALSVTDISAALEDPSRGIGMHFFNPVPRMRLCEIVRGGRTSADVVERARKFADLLGKETVVVSDVAGFATSRINALIGAEAMRMLEAGVASAEDIDTAVRLGLNHPMGPLEMGDLVGWDVRLDILSYLQNELGSRFAPTEMHRTLVAEGNLGRKTGRGVYEYDANGRRIKPGSGGASDQ